MKQTLSFQVKIKDKKVVFENRKYFDWMIAKTFKDGEKLTMTLENTRSQRSLAQNNFWWGICYKIIAETTGHTTEEIHEIMKAMFLPKKFITLKGIEFEIPKSTTKLSKGEVVEYTDKIILFAAVELNAYIPTPCEAGFLCGRSDCPTCSKGETNYP